MSTPMERADEMARLVIAAAQRDNACVVTRDLVDTVVKMHADTEPGKANAASVRRLIRARASAAGVRVVLTDDERYWAIREQLHHMSGDQVHALRDSIVDGGEDDPRGHDQVLVDAISVRLSNRVPPRRLDGVEPVSVRLWDEGPVPDTEQSPAYAMRTVNGGTPERIELDAARREVRWAMTEEGRKGVRALSGVGDVATITYERVTDLRTLAPGDHLRQYHENHTTSHLTVLEPYGRHQGGTGVRCRREGSETWTTVLTQHSADAGPVWRATT